MTEYTTTQLEDALWEIAKRRVDGTEAAEEAAQDLRISQLEAENIMLRKQVWLLSQLLELDTEFGYGTGN